MPRTAAFATRQLDKALRAATDTGESLDAIVVGCGMAGLSACWAYRKGRPDATVLMLDQHPIFGGEAKQNEFEVDGYHLTAPQGATGIVVPFNKAKDAGMWTHFATDLGFPDEFVYQKPTGHEPRHSRAGGRVVADARCLGAIRHRFLLRG